MEISLVRHGESLHIEKKKLTCNEFSNWIYSHNNAGVFEIDQYPSSETQEKIAKAGLVLTSDLKRTMDSAALLGSVHIVSDSLFREYKI